MSIKNLGLGIRACCGTLLAANLIFAASLSAADWPQWRGPQRNGISEETGLLKQWPKEGPKLLWQLHEIGFGYSTPAVVGKQLYLLSNTGDEDEFVQALSVEDGKQVWSRRIGKVGNPDQKPPYPGARSTPTVDGKLLYAIGSDGDVVCLNLDNGQQLWHKSLRSDLGGKPGVWAYAESPLIDGPLLVCTPGGAEATLAALDKKTGDVVWKCPVPGGEQAAYSSVVIDKVDGKKEYVQFLQKGVVGVDAATGKFLWRYDRTAEGSPANIPTPLAEGEFVYSAAGRSGGGLVKLKGQGEGVAAEQVYFSPKLPTSIGGAVKTGDYLYGTNGQALVCAQFSNGDIKWTDRGIGPGGICYADGCLYLHGENGQVALVKATPASYEELGRFTPPGEPDRGRSKAWTYPVVANGRLYIRDLGSLWCYDIRDSQSAK